MAAVMADTATVRNHIDDVDGVVVANINHPKQVSISGTTSAVEEARRKLERAGLEVRPLAVSHAFHSPLVEGVAPAIADALDGMTLASPQRTVASGVAAEPYGGGRGPDARDAHGPRRRTRRLPRGRASGP